MLNNVIDISHFQTVTSFQEVKNNGIVGVIHKATQGRTMVDAKYHARRQRALDAGLLWGAYHFGTKADVEQQVEHFLNTTNPTATDLLVLDFEPNPIGESGTMTLSQAERFVTLVNERIGRFPGLYSGQSFIREKVGNRTTTLSNCFLWIARYSSNLPIVPPAWKTFTFWQYTDGNAGDQPHQVPGIGRCDRNKFNGSLAGLQRLWGVSNVQTFFETLTRNENANSPLMTAVAQSLEQLLKDSLKEFLEGRFSNQVASSWFTNPFSVYPQTVDEAKDLVLRATEIVGEPEGIILPPIRIAALQATVSLSSTPKDVIPFMRRALL